MEVLDSVAHSVRVKPENLRLAEVSGFNLGSKMYAALHGIRPPTVIWLCPTCLWVALLGTERCRRAAPPQQGKGRSSFPFRVVKWAQHPCDAAVPHSSLWG